MGIFRKRWEFYYTPKRKIPTAPPSVPPDVSTTLVSKIHPSRNISLRDHTFRIVLWQYYTPKRVLYSAIFVPGALWTKHPRLRNVWDRKTEYRYYKPKRVLPPSVTVAPSDVSVPLISKVHPSRNPKLRDGTFRRQLRKYLRPKRISLPSIPCFFPLTPDCDGTIDGTITHDVDKTPPFFTHINEDPSSPGTDWIANDLTESPGNAFICIPNMPADFASAVSLTIEYSRQAVGFSNDTATLSAQIFASDESTAFTDEITLADQTDTTKITETGTFVINATGLAASRADWNTAFVRFRWAYTQTGGPDNAQIRLFAEALEICYVATVALPPIIQRTHPSRNPRLRDSTFRPPFLDYFQPRRVLPPSQFVPGALSARRKLSWDRKTEYRYYRLKRALPPSVTVAPSDVSVPLISKVHPSRNPKLRDKTFRPKLREFQRPKLPPALFVPGALWAKHPRLRNVWDRKTEYRYYKPKRVLPPTIFIPGMTNAVQLVHPSRNPRLRDNTFRPPWLERFQPKRVLPTSIFLPGILNAVQRVHPSVNHRLRDDTFRPPWLDFYQPKRVLPPNVFVPGITNVIPITYPSRNPRLRDSTFRPPWLQYFQPKRVLPPVIFVPGITNIPPIVYPSRNPRLRDSTFRPPFLDYFQPKRALYPSQFVPGGLVAKHPKKTWDRKTEYRYYRVRRALPSSIAVVGVPIVSKTHPSRNPRLRDETFRKLWLEGFQLKRVLPPAFFVPGVLVAISKVHPSKNIRLRDETFRPPFRNYYKPNYLYLNVPPFAGGIPDAMFKQMYKGMSKRMEPA